MDAQCYRHDPLLEAIRVTDRNRGFIKHPPVKCMAKYSRSSTEKKSVLSSEPLRCVKGCGLLGDGKLSEA